MQKTILTIIFALLLALTSWAQKFTISGDLSVMTNKFDLPPAKANIVYIWNDSLKDTPIEYAVKDGKFEISGNVSRPIYSKLMVQLEIEVEGRKDTTTEGSDAYKNSSTFLASLTTKLSPPTAAVSAMTCESTVSTTLTMN